MHQNSLKGFGMQEHCVGGLIWSLEEMAGAEVEEVDQRRKVVAQCHFGYEKLAGWFHLNWFVEYARSVV
jgi:hypothetical protein